jgi:hypothetical protein
MNNYEVILLRYLAILLIFFDMTVLCIGSFALLEIIIWNSLFLYIII